MTTPTTPEPSEGGPGEPSDPSRVSATTPRLNDPFVRYDARTLDPSSAARSPGLAAPSVTGYRGAVLLFTGKSRADIEELVRRVSDLIDTNNLALRVSEQNPFVIIERDDVEFSRHNKRARLLLAAEGRGLTLVAPFTFVAAGQGGPAAPVDVWALLQVIRTSQDQELIGAVGLDHLMYSAAPVIMGNPFGGRVTSISGDPFGGRVTSVGTDSYLQPGGGGHGPVGVVLPSPQPMGPERPVVVVLDTGADDSHPWFGSGHVQRRLELISIAPDCVGEDVNLPEVIASDPEGLGSVPDPMTGMLGTHAGHGTFITGLLRQTCPNAVVWALRVFGCDGVVPESDLTDALTGLGIALSDGSLERADALVLSLGYYAETGDDLTYSAGLKLLLADLVNHGVEIFCAAGNDCTTTPFFPAGFAVTAPFGSANVAGHLHSVAALNPDGQSVALFSNDGDWVTDYAVGANVVSTAPRSAMGSMRAGVDFAGPFGRSRSTLDPDNYASGFATWSGTSFAAPIQAGQYLQGLPATVVA